MAAPARVRPTAVSTSGGALAELDGRSWLLIVARFSEAGSGCSPTVGAAGAEGSRRGAEVWTSPKVKTRRGRSLGLEYGTANAPSITRSERPVLPKRGCRTLSV